MLFSGSHELEHRWLEAVAAAPPDATPLAAVTAGFGGVAEMLEERHAFARLRARIVDVHAELQERELIRLQTLAAGIAQALRARGVSPNASIVASQAGVTVFHVAFARWAAQDGPAAFRRLMDESLAELREVATAL